MTKTTPHSPKAVSSKGPLSNLNRLFPWLLVICGLIGIVAALVITQDKFDLAKHANFQPSCNLNPIISCGSVMKSPQAHAFGFMNPYIGLVGFPIVITTGMALFAGAKLKRWWWWGMQAGITFGFAFAYWLLFESVYRIHALCPWCLSVDVAITILFWYQTLFNFYNGFIPMPTWAKRVGRSVKHHHADIIIFWFLLVIAVILKHFWYYFGQHL